MADRQTGRRARTGQPTSTDAQHPYAPAAPPPASSTPAPVSAFEPRVMPVQFFAMLPAEVDENVRMTGKQPGSSIQGIVERAFRHYFSLPDEHRARLRAAEPTRTSEGGTAPLVRFASKIPQDLEHAIAMEAAMTRSKKQTIAAAAIREYLGTPHP